jgi:nucleotide-binding universal stress UspA family protein
MTKTQIKSVLVAVDFSPQSKAAVAQARRFAKKFRVPLNFVHVFNDPFVSESRFADIIQSLKIFHGKRLRHYYKVTDKENVFVECGTPYQKILRVAKTLRSPLIVAGHTGLGNALVTALMGSTAEKLVMNSPCPVWIERGKGDHQTRSALIPTDLGDRAPQTETLVRRLGLGDRRREIFHVVPPPYPVLDLQAWREMTAEIERSNKEALKRFKAHNPKLTVKEEWGNVAGEIAKRAKKFDFIALSPREHRGFFGGFGSVTAKLVRNSPIPMLVIP